MKEESKKAVGFLGVVVLAVGTLLAFSLFGCGSNDTKQSSEQAPDSPSGQISVYSREDGSGTRSAFIELFGIEQKDDTGNKIDRTTSAAAITNSTSVMMTSVAGDDQAIGYISLGSLNDTVRALEVDGAQASVDNVKNGSYKISRPFMVVKGENLSDEADDFMKFIMSKDGQAIVEEAGYVAVEDDAAAYASSGCSGKVVVAGSSSVAPVMEKLAEAYEKANPDMTIEVQQSDSTAGVNMTIEGTCDLGMASRDLKDSEKGAGASSTEIARDGIAVIVAPDSAVDSFTSDQIMKIFTGDVTDWSQI